jgi:arsenate reductase
MKKEHRLYPEIETLINGIDVSKISKERQQVLQGLIDFIQEKKNAGLLINLNFICTHNSRRSHLSQVWAQAIAAYFNIKNVYCYSGGTEATALFPLVAMTLKNVGFKFTILAESGNSVYSIKYGKNEHPIIGFSKTFDDVFNPKSEFAAIMTCSHADENCPFISGAEKRIPITYEDPKAFDNTPQQSVKYEERNLQIATELYYVFSNIQNN